MTEEQIFWQQLEKDGTENTTKLVFADWLDEHGDARTAYALRWCVNRNRWPAYAIRRVYPDSTEGYWYWRGGGGNKKSATTTNSIPPTVYSGVKRAGGADARRWAKKDGFTNAIVSLGKALDSLQAHYTLLPN